MTRTHKAALAPANRQETALRQHAGYARVAWNWGVGETRRALDAGEPHATDDRRFRPVWNSVKDTLFPWCREHSQNAAKAALIDLGAAWKRYWADRKKPSGRKVHRPRFHSRKHGMAFRADNGRGTVQADAGGVVLPRIGRVRLSEAPRWTGPILECTVKHDGRRWHAHLVYELPGQAPKADGLVVGVDAGLRRLATVDDGTSVTVVDNPRPLKRALRKLRRVNRRICRSRRIHGCHRRSDRRNRCYAQRKRLYRRMADIRRDCAHQAASAIVKRARLVCIEDLHVAGWLRNRSLARSTSDAAPAAFLRVLRDACERKGVGVVQTGRFFPSSKTCPDCGAVNADLGMEPAWTCPSCGRLHPDRDAVAARNLRRQGLAALDLNQDVESMSDAACGAVLREASTRQIIADQAR